MRQHHLSVTTLEEFEPNSEFAGRNFNAGECIQLVLKSRTRNPGRHDHRWLPLGYVQMVMMHELAHCRQMNHSRAFWAVRNQYASQMRDLLAAGYLGDGIWGRGAPVAAAAAAAAAGERERGGSGSGGGGGDDDEAQLVPEHLCGGTYRSRRRTRTRKRKQKPVVSYQERKQRRIEKRFGKNGTALGADEEAKVALEKGKKVAGKPRVAGSARGRELRAAAALARFGKQKVEEEKEKKEEEEKEKKTLVLKDEETESGSESGDEYEDAEDGEDDAVDIDGSSLRDGQGRKMIKVCEDEDVDDAEAMSELGQLTAIFRKDIKMESPDPVSLICID